jgi:hypothetical protein
MQSLVENVVLPPKIRRSTARARNFWIVTVLVLGILGAAGVSADQPQPDTNNAKQQNSKSTKTKAKSPPTRVRIPISPEEEAAIIAADALVPREQIVTGPMATLSLFGSEPAIGRSFVFVMDRSKSMALGTIQSVAKELAARLTKLRPEQTMQVVAYNEKPAYLTGRELIPATDENKRNLITFVTNLTANGQTAHNRGVASALRLKPEVIYLLTDGGDPLLSLGDLLAIRDENAGRTEIHCIQFGRGPQPQSADILKKLAAQNRGHYTYVDLNSR